MLHVNFKTLRFPVDAPSPPPAQSDTRLSLLEPQATQTRNNEHWRTSALLRNIDFEISLVFSVTSFKIDQNKNQNLSIDKVQNLGNERRYIYKDPRQDSDQRNISYTRYPRNVLPKLIYRDLYGDAMLVLTWMSIMSSNMADENQQKHLLLSFATKA